MRPIGSRPQVSEPREQRNIGNCFYINLNHLIQEHVKQYTKMYSHRVGGIDLYRQESSFSVTLNVVDNGVRRYVKRGR